MHHTKKSELRRRADDEQRQRHRIWPSPRERSSGDLPASGNTVSARHVSVAARLRPIRPPKELLNCWPSAAAVRVELEAGMLGTVSDPGARVQA